MPSRYTAPTAMAVADGWTLARLTPPSRLHGANGITTGADGRIWVAQVPASQVSAINPDTGAVEVISPMGGDIVAPDDLAFDDHGNLYLTEITLGRVAVRSPDGRTRVLRGDIPVANPITWHEGRLFAGECRIGARLLELDLAGGAPRVILEGVPMANAFQVGPDGKLYVPVMGANAIWRVDLATGAHEVVAGDLGVPDSVKFDAKGRIVSTQVASGEVLRIDPQTGQREVLANLGPGLDNVTFVGERLFVSSINGSITEILAPGSVRPLIERGLQWPLGIAAAGDGSVFVCDGVFGYQVDRTAAGPEALRLAAMVFWPGCPGYLRGVAAGAATGEWVITTGLGAVALYRPAEGASDILASGFDQLMGVDRAASGLVAFAEYGAGCVHLFEGSEVRRLAAGLDGPMGLALLGDEVIVAEAGAGRVTRITASGATETLAEGLGRPEGLCLRDGQVCVVDTAGKRVLAIDPASGCVTALASGLPVGTPPGVVPHFLGPIGDMSGPMINFAGIACDPEGTLLIAGDAEGSVLALAADPA
ncbi:SMP-30/gluconolactonase/LRE family protein [Novosphingobium piscinae]|uniref:SMP-30/gluconolactonase/LRE family protein n=2 Tax=Novosphingobium piscinae TaxID=1507448 RepID=A0A7X1FVC7_9SPHN|nr:SMP-30/gluconolactonase/LRE family protein [Novosphingobium piscinae]